MLIAALGLLVIGLAASGVFIHQQLEFATGSFISPISIAILATFVLAMWILYHTERRGPATIHPEPDSSMRRAFVIYAISAAAVVAAAIWLANTGDSLAEELGLERSFVGTQFLALSTSLPELAASIAAIRLGAPELAISSVLGSNLFNMGFVLFADDLVYTDGPLWEVVAPVHIFTAITAMLMTAVVIVALATQERGRPGRFFTFEAVMLAVLYVGGSVLIFELA